MSIALGIGEYLCSTNVLKAHALAYRSYRNTFYDRFKGQIGITLSSRFFYSETNDTNLVDRAMQFYVRNQNRFYFEIQMRMEFNRIKTNISARMVCSSNIQFKWKLSGSDDYTNNKQ